MSKLSTLQKRIIAALAAVLVVVAAVAIVHRVNMSAEAKAIAAEAEATEGASETVNPEDLGEVKTELEETEETAEAEAEAEEATADTEAVTATVTTGLSDVAMDEAPDVDELAYADVITEEEIHEFTEFLEEQPDADEDLVRAFYETYGDKLRNWKLTPDGQYVHLLYDLSLMQTDETRPQAAVEMGLSKTQIDDAVSFPFDLTYKQVNLILAAKQNQVVDFTDDEVEAQMWEFFDELLGSYVLAEGHIGLFCDQKIADYSTVSENYTAGRTFLEKAEASRTSTYAGEGADPYADIRGKGANIWLRKISGQHYTNEEFQKYVVSFIMVLLPRDARVQVLNAKAGDHKHLIAGDFNSMRVATYANYAENLASLTFPFYTKTGKVALYYGANERDKRPEVLNPTVTKKPVAKKPDPPVVVTVEQTEQDLIALWIAATGSNSGGGGGGNTPNNPYTPPSNNVEYKSPASGTASQTGRGDGFGKNDDSSQGTQKADQGNSKSDTVAGSQYQQGTSTNTDGGNTASYDSGPKADNTDNGSAPSTSTPITTSEAKSNSTGTDSGSGDKGGTSKESASEKISEPPADD